MMTLGIDLGTTNTVAAIEAKVLALDSSGTFLFPSVVAYLPNGAIIVGHGARRRRAIDPRNTIFSAKRLIGRTWNSSDTSEFLRRYPFDVAESDGHPVFKTRAGDVSPTQIASAILAAVRKATRVDPDNVIAVVTVPSMFTDAHRTATLRAAELAGFVNVEIISEPIAVAQAHLSRLTNRPSLAAVYDFGGGTFDLAIVDCSDRKIRLVAHSGDLYLGGDDVDAQLRRWAVHEVMQQYGWDLQTDPAVFARLLVECERAKIRLADVDETDLDLTQVDLAAPSSCLSVRLSRQVTDQYAQDLVQRTFILCDDVLRKAGVKATQVDAVFPAGGTTLLPAVKAGIATYFGRPVLHTCNPLQLVAIGASLALERL